MEYKIRFIDYPEHYRKYWSELHPVIVDCLSHGDLIMREHLDSFEANLASFIGVKYAIGLNSGTDALFFALKCADLGPGDEVITVSHTFVATISTIIHAGATPVLIDIDEDMNMDTSLIESVINDRTKAIVPVHLNGRMCNMEKISELATKYNLHIIEDAAQSLGATYNGIKAGSTGIAGCFSFYPAKILGSAGDGGALVTNDELMAQKVRQMRDHGMDRKSGEILFHGYNSRLDNIQAAILDVKLRYLPTWIERRREIALMYNKGLENIGEIILPPHFHNDDTFYDVYQNYVIRTPRRDDLVAYLQREGVEVLISWRIPNHKQKALHLDHYNLPITEEISKTVLSLPMYPELSNNQVEEIISIISKFYMET